MANYVKVFMQRWSCFKVWLKQNFFDMKDFGIEMLKMLEKKSVSSRYSLCKFSGKKENFEFFGPNLPKNGFRVGNSENYCRNKYQHPRDTVCANFQPKRAFFTFSAQICQKFDFGVGISKILVWIRNQHPQDTVRNFSQNG